MENSGLNLPYLQDLYLHDITVNYDLPASNLSGSDQFSLSHFYQNYSDTRLFSEHNLTALEDFEVFDGRDLMNVVAYSIMSLGKEQGYLAVMALIQVFFLGPLKLFY